MAVSDSAPRLTNSQHVKGMTSWTSYTVSAPWNSPARNLVIGFVLTSPGKAWAEDLELLLDGVPVWDAPKISIDQTVFDTDTEFVHGSRISLVTLTPTGYQR